MLYTFRKKIELKGGRALWIVREDRNPEVLISYTEGEGESVRKRLTISLSQVEAVQVAKFLAGIFTADDAGSEDDDFCEDTIHGIKS